MAQHAQPELRLRRNDGRISLQLPIQFRFLSILDPDAFAELLETCHVLTFVRVVSIDDKII